jgi:putative FmdB family regulatory protein
MPIFAYRCDSCGFEKDVLQKRSDPPLGTCPSCGRESFAKRLTAPAFQLKGSGWYVTDFRDNGKGKAKPDSQEAGASQASEAPAGKSPAGESPASPQAAPAPAAAPSAAPSAASTSAPAAGTKAA